jgi:argininosuccinate synthase
MHYKDIVAQKYAEMVYYGRWFTPLKEALDAFVRSTQKNVTGTARIKLYKGKCTLVGRKSPYSLYREDYATFGVDNVYDQSDAEGFINLYGLPLKVRALLEQERRQGKGLAAQEGREFEYTGFKRD